MGMHIECFLLLFIKESLQLFTWKKLDDGNLRWDEGGLVVDEDEIMTWDRGNILQTFHFNQSHLQQMLVMQWNEC